MARLVTIILLSLVAAAPAASQTSSKPDSWRIRKLPMIEPPEWRLPGTEVGSNGRFGLGMFGLKSDALRQRPVTGREIATPRPRRAGVGISLKF